jgi:multidrug efflux pump subunit AcrB
LKRIADRSQNSFITLDQVRTMVQGLTGVKVVVDRPQEMPTGKPVSVRLSGDDFQVLQTTSNTLMQAMNKIPGLLNIEDDFDEGYPELRIEVDRVAAALANTNTRAIADTVRTALAGTEVAKYRIGEDEYEIVVRLPRGERRSIDSIEELTVQDEDGAPRPLLSLARIRTTSGPAAITRVDMHRTITVEADVDHAAGFQDEAMRILVAGILEDEMTLGPEVSYVFAGSNEEEKESSEFLTRAFFIALLLIGLILVTEFDSLVTPLTILISVVLSLIGVLWGLMITSTPFGIIMTGIGVISLAGIVVNNAIVLCDFILQLRSKGMPRKEAIVEAGLVRIRPVLLTAITTVLGLMPLTTGVNFDFFTFSIITGGESTQWWGAMGVAVIFGLTVATGLTLLVVPVTYDVLASLSERFSRPASVER